MLAAHPMLPWKVFIVALWFAALAAGERLLPAVPRPRGRDVSRLVRNLAFALGNALMSPALTVPISVAAAGVQLWTRPDMPSWAGFALDWLLMDLWAYAWHRANHEWPLLWRFHRVHHLDQFLDTTSAVRFHPGEVLISAMARAPLIIAADIPAASVVLFETLVLLAALFHHSDLRLPAGLERALRLVVVTPSHHWVHHHALRADTDSNYGTVLTVWDRVFGSWSPSARTPDMVVGVEGESDAPLAALTVAPFVVSPRSPSP